MFDLASLRPPPPAPPKPRRGEKYLRSGWIEPGSIEAKVYAALYSRASLVLVSSPPGGGKSSLATALVTRLVIDTDLHVVVAAPTTTMCMDLARRLAQAADGRHRVTLQGSAFSSAVLPGVEVSIGPVLEGVVVRTVASCAMAPPDCDVLVFDEAYQVTTAQAAAAAQNADQVLMVGDPGQIGPVTTVDTTAWDRFALSPHSRAPEGFAAREDAVRLSMPFTYRLGSTSAHAVAPIYDFTFDSARPDVAVAGHAEIETILVDPTDRLDDPAIMRMVAERAMSFVGATTENDGPSQRLTQEDIFVIAARNQQTSSLRALLNGLGGSGVAVGTADLLQGAQRAVVVAVDPLLGSPVVSQHASSLGRVCVMASRHFAHLSWVSGSDYAQAIADADLDEAEAKVHLRVRRRLLRPTPHTSGA